MRSLWECVADDQAIETSVGEENSKTCRSDSDDEQNDEYFESTTAEIPLLNASLTSTSNYQTVYLSFIFSLHSLLLIKVTGL